MSRPRTPQPVKDFLASAPSWLIIRDPVSVESISKLDPGERAAVSLAKELHADFLLIDERDGRRAAIQRNVPIVGTIGVLELAAQRDLLSLPAAIQKLPNDFAVRLATEIIEDALERDALRKGNSH